VAAMTTEWPRWLLATINESHEGAIKKRVEGSVSMRVGPSSLNGPFVASPIRRELPRALYREVLRLLPGTGRNQRQSLRVLSENSRRQSTAPRKEIHLVPRKKSMPSSRNAIRRSPATRRSYRCSQTTMKITYLSAPDSALKRLVEATPSGWRTGRALARPAPCVSGAVSMDTA
jgi:hypothetical protein